MEFPRICDVFSEKQDIVPQRVRVIRQILPKYACRDCEGTKDNRPTVKVAPMPHQLIEQGIVTSRLLAYILVSQFCEGCPFTGRAEYSTDSAWRSPWSPYRAGHSRLRGGANRSKQARSSTWTRRLYRFSRNQVARTPPSRICGSPAAARISARCPLSLRAHSRREGRFI